MNWLHILRKSGLAALIATIAMFVSLPTQAGMVGTASLGNSMQVTTTAEALVEQRQWIQSQLEANGVTHADAVLRVSNLSDSQVQQIHQRIEEMPAGAGPVGVILFGILVLAITDLIGLTDVFPFIRPTQ